MTLVKKTASEIHWFWDGVTIDQSTGRLACHFYAANPYITAGSVGTFEYSEDGTTWYPGTLVANQSLAVDEFDIPSKHKRFTLQWSAIDDIWFTALTDLQIRMTLWDRPNQAGTESDAETHTIPSLSFAPGEITTVDRPVAHDPFFDWQWTNPVLLRPVRLHHRIAVGPDQELTTEAAVADSSQDQTHWGADGGAYPADGIDGSQAIVITNTDPAFDALANQEWWWQITRTVAASHYHAIITSPESADLIPANQTVTFNGTVGVD